MEKRQEACRRLVSAAGTMNVTFHRAFDMVRDPLASLETVISLGCSRILTSGCAPTATEGAPMLRALREHARGRIIILAGGGVDPSNAVALISSGAADELHASAKELIPSAMTFRNDSVKMGKKDADEYMRPTSSRQIISQIIKVINNI
ncbi:MAG: hypothetical protein K2F63_01550 [Muribaculaceae bacterium]|nr:hypothetical protein [Muribaculaceae bacterium]